MFSRNFFVIFICLGLFASDAIAMENPHGHGCMDRDREDGGGSADTGGSGGGNADALIAALLRGTQEANTATERALRAAGGLDAKITRAQRAVQSAHTSAAEVSRAHNDIMGTGWSSGALQQIQRLHESCGVKQGEAQRNAQSAGRLADVMEQQRGEYQRAIQDGRQTIAQAQEEVGRAAAQTREELGRLAETNRTQFQQDLRGAEGDLDRRVNEAAAEHQRQIDAAGAAQRTQTEQTGVGQRQELERHAAAERTRVTEPAEQFLHDIQRQRAEAQTETARLAGERAQFEREQAAAQVAERRETEVQARRVEAEVGAIAPIIQAERLAQGRADIEAGRDTQAAQQFRTVIEMKREEAAAAAEGEIRVAEKQVEVERVRATGAVDAARTKWQSISRILSEFGGGVKNYLSQPKNVAMIVAAVGGIIALRYAIPALIRYVESVLYKPKVYIETSYKAFGQNAHVNTHAQTLDEFIAKPALKEQVMRLAEQIKKAKENGVPLKNLLFEGLPGTGKTMCARALAYYSGLDYAITSGSEFTKIKDLNVAIDELRKIICWGKASKRGMIVFIDEAESMLVAKIAKDASEHSVALINAFQSLVSDASDSNIMFVFATNHAFKLESAVLSRIAETVKFDLPGQEERAALIDLYAAKAISQAKLNVSDYFAANVDQFARQLDGVSPRQIKELMIEVARCTLVDGQTEITAAIARDVIARGKDRIAQERAWSEQQRRWIANGAVAA